MTNSGDLVRQLIAEAGDSIEMTARRAGYINPDGTVVEIPADPDGVVRVRWNVKPRDLLRASE